MRIIIDGDGVTRTFSPIDNEFGGPTWGWAVFDHKGVRMTVCFSDGDETGWDHVSVSKRSRCPTWIEMDAVKRRFFKDDETVMQLHLPVGKNLSFHPYCLHLWRPTRETIPVPTPELVGTAGIGKAR